MQNFLGFQTRPTASGRIGFRTYDVITRVHLCEPRSREARGRTPEEALASLKLDNDERVMSISERPERCQQ